MHHLGYAAMCTYRDIIALKIGLCNLSHSFPLLELLGADAEVFVVYFDHQPPRGIE